MDHYIRAKEIAVALSQKRKPTISVIDFLIYWWAKYFKCGWIKTFFRANLRNRLVSRFLLTYNQIITSGTFPNYIATALLGFSGGIFITYVYFSVCSVILDLTIPSAFYFSVFLCLFLTIGLAFIRSVRCVTLSILPEICTRKARSMLVSYALVLMIMGPGSNILYNTRQLTETITCTREQLHTLQHNLTELYMKPLRALKHGIENLIYKVRPVIETIKSGINWVRDSAITVVNLIKRAFSWLHTFKSICNNEIGTPFEFCYRAVDKAIQDCEVKVVPGFKFLCSVGTVAQKTCYSLKVLDFFCQFIPFLKDEIFTYIQNKVKDIGRFVKTLFYVSVSFHHSFAFKTNQSKTTTKILQDVFHAEENRLKRFFHVLHFMKLTLGCYILYVLISTFVYRFRFFHSLYYDNYHINKFILELDWKRASIRRQTLFPLTLGEKMRYVSLFSLRLTIAERINVLKESVFLMLSAIKVIFLLLIDYLLHWILTLISHHANLQFHFGNDRSKISAEGSGLWHTLYTVVNSLLKPFDTEFHFNTQPCLPEPIPPAYDIYERVGYIIGFAWMMVFFQPFGLRFRNYIMSHYHPEAARRRAVYLYNYILQSRGNISLYIRRQIFRKVSFGLRTDKPNLLKWLIMRYPRLKYFLPYRDVSKECMVCGYPKPNYRCVTPDCPGVYCKDCFEQLMLVCMLCNMPHDYKGLDVSEEEDSDEEFEEEALGDELPAKPWWKFWMISTNVDRDLMLLKNLEEAQIHLFKTNEKDTENDLNTKDYFDEKWRRDDWAKMEDFFIPLPDFSIWARPEYLSRFDLFH